MLDRVQGMIEKLKYLNRKILEIDKKQSLLVEKEELLEKNLEQRVEKVIVSVDQMKQFTEQCADEICFYAEGKVKANVTKSDLEF